MHVLQQSELDKLVVGKTVTVTYTIRYIGDKHDSTRSETGRVIKVTDKSVELRSKPIRGLSSNVTTMIGLKAITAVKA